MGWEGCWGDDRRGPDRPDTSRLFRAAPADQGDRTDTIGVARDGAQGEPRQIHIAIEVPHGPVVETLIERSFKVHAINPKQMDRFRDRFTLAGAKDDMGRNPCP